jgi:hypothetical protein
MSALPGPLKPWAPQLAVLQRDLALAIAPLIQRLSLGIGPLSDASARPAGAPDGYDGVARKGSYERLLVTEWLYADEAPEEFLRRAAQGEHLFSRLAVREPHEARQCLVLFDSGPSQLGAPRIAQLAAFIAFAARSEAANARFTWGVLQHTPDSARTGFDREQAQAFLKSRTTREPTIVELRAWLDALGATADDVWLVGGRSTCALAEASKLQLIEVHQPNDDARLDVSVRRAARTRQSVQLALPAPAICTALLRDPFPAEKRPATPRTARPSRGLVLSTAGNRAFTKGASGELIAITLPNGSPGTTRLVAFQPPTLDRVIAAGWHGGLLAVTARYDLSGRPLRLMLWRLSKRGEQKGSPQAFELAPDTRFRSADGDPLSGICTLSVGAQKRFVIAIQDRAWVLFDGRATERLNQVITFTQRSDRAIFFTIDAEGRRHVRNLFPNDAEDALLIEGVGACQAFFAGGRPSRTPLLAIGQPGGDRWMVVDHDRPSVGLDLPSGALVVGTTLSYHWPLGLLVLSKDRRTLQHLSAAGRQVIVESEQPIVTVAPDHVLPRFVWLDAFGAIGLFDCSTPSRVILGFPDGGGRRAMHFSVVRR